MSSHCLEGEGEGQCTMSKGLIRFVSTQCSTHVYRTDLASADPLLVHIHVYTGLLANAFVLED